jgi:hypothetical protein
MLVYILMNNVISATRITGSIVNVVCFMRIRKHLFQKNKKEAKIQNIVWAHNSFWAYGFGSINRKFRNEQLNCFVRYLE